MAEKERPDGGYTWMDTLDSNRGAETPTMPSGQESSGDSGDSSSTDSSGDSGSGGILDAIGLSPSGSDADQ